MVYFKKEKVTKQKDFLKSN